MYAHIWRVFANVRTYGHIFYMETFSYVLMELEKDCDIVTDIFQYVDYNFHIRT